jgi:hypothetical protein
MENLSYKFIRGSLRKKDIPVTRTILGYHLKARWLYFKTGNIHWVFREAYGFVILNLITVEAFNTARMKNRMAKLRLRDLNRICCFRFPRRGWIVKTPKLKADK